MKNVRTRTLRIALDGPAATGKSTLARALSKDLHIDCFLTGKMYRGLALFLLKQRIDWQEEKKVEEVLGRADVKYIFDHTKEMGGDVMVNEKVVSDQLHNDNVAIVASRIATYKQVREMMVGVQKDLIKNRSVVVEGRDIGLRVIPDAELKIFLTALFSKRVARRIEQYKQYGILKTYEAVEHEMLLRDQEDMGRKLDPLQKTGDSIVIDNTSQTPQETLLYIKKIVQEKKLL